MTLFCCSLMINETQLQEIREARNKMRFPQTLVDLAIKTVAKHCTRFIDDIPDNPLKYLRKSIKKQNY
jgi:hypothetical protein